MNAIQELFLSRCKIDSDTRKAIVAGQHTEDFIVRVRGTLRKAEDIPAKRCPQKARPWDLLAVALSKLNGVTVDALVREATELDDKAASEVKKQAEKATVLLMGTHTTFAHGRIDGDVSTELVEVKEETDLVEMTKTIFGL